MFIVFCQYLLFIVFFAFFVPTLLLEIVENILFEDTYDGVLCKAAESFEDKSNYIYQINKKGKLLRIKSSAVGINKSQSFWFVLTYI